MELVKNGVTQWKTTALGILTFLTLFLPQFAHIISDIGSFLQKVAEVVASGNWLGLITLHEPLIALIASIGLIISRDWNSGESSDE